MRSDNPAGTKFKRVCTYFSNLEVLTKSSILGDIQVTCAHASVRNKYLGEMVTTFALEESLEVPTVVSINIEPTFASNGNKICLLTTEVLLCATADDLAKSNTLRNWASRNAVLRPSFVTETVFTNGETLGEVLLKIFFERLK